MAKPARLTLTGIHKSILLVIKIICPFITNQWFKLIEIFLFNKFFDRKNSIFTTSYFRNMKSSELNKLILRNGWKVVRQSGSHIIYEKNGTHYPVTFHGSKEVGKGLENKIKKELGLK
jgi:mRNA interferase HicA